MKTIALSQHERPRLLVEGDCFKVTSPEPVLKVSYPFTAKNGKQMDACDYYLVVRLINDGKEQQPAVMILREANFKSLQADLARMKARRGLVPQDLDSWSAEVLDRGVRVYEER